jgi:hypothetical protein
VTDDDFKPIAKLIGEMMAAATHDLKTADPSDVGMNGVPIRAWREAYAEGCKDMANKVVSGFATEQFATAKQNVMEAFHAEMEKLAPTPKGE